MKAKNVLLLIVVLSVLFFIMLGAVLSFVFEEKKEKINLALSEEKIAAQEIASSLRIGDIDKAKEKAIEARDSLNNIKNEIAFLDAMPRFVFGGERDCARKMISKGNYLLDLADFLLAGVKSAGIDTVKVKYEDLTSDDFQSVLNWMLVNKEQIDKFKDLAKNNSEQTCEVQQKQLVEADKNLTQYILSANKFLNNSDSIIELLHLVGVPSERRYLFLIQNAQDLRPGGGLMSVYGIARFNNGKLVEIKSDHVVESLDKVYIQPTEKNPEPIKKYIRKENNLVIYDANWNPDHNEWLPKVFSTWNSAEKDEPVDGVVVISTPLLEKIIDDYGGLEIPGINEKFTSQNLVASLDYITDAKTNKKGADYRVLGSVLEQIIKKITTTNLEQLEKISQTFSEGLKSRDVYVYMPGEEEKNALNKMGQPDLAIPTGDEIFIADSGLGSGKSDAVMKRSLSILINARDEKKVISEAIMSYNFSLAKADFRTFPYNGYVRFGLPVGSQFTEVIGANTSKPDITNESGRLFIGNYYALPLGGRQKVALFYTPSTEVANSFATGNYSLMLRKQSGVTMPFEVRIMLPKKTNFKAEVDEGTVYNEGKSEIVWRGTLDRDLQLRLSI